MRREFRGRCPRLLNCALAGLSVMGTMPKLPCSGSPLGKSFRRSWASTGLSMLRMTALERFSATRLKVAAPSAWADPSQPLRQALKAPVRPELSRNLCIFGQKARFIIGHVVNVAFVFMHIPGSIFVFNIFFGPSPISDLDERVGDPQQLTQVAIFRLGAFVSWWSSSPNRAQFSVISFQ